MQCLLYLGSCCLDQQNVQRHKHTSGEVEYLIYLLINGKQKVVINGTEMLCRI